MVLNNNNTISTLIQRFNAVAAVLGTFAPITPEEDV